MAEKNYKVGEPIKVVYQAPNKQSGLTITAEIILPGNVKDSNFPDQVLSELLGKGVYTGEFTPDAAGEWETIVSKPGGEGQVVKRYSVGSHDVHSVGEGVATVDGKANSIQTAIADVDSDVAAVGGLVSALPNAAQVNVEVDTALEDYDAAKKAELDAAETAIRGTDADTLKTLSDQIDSVDNKVGGLDTPPMIS